MHSTKLACVTDYENYAKEFLAPPMFTHIKGESPQQYDDFRNIQLKLRGLANLKHFTDPLRTEVFSMSLASPVGFGPFPHQGMVHPEGEIASAKAA